LQLSFSYWPSSPLKESLPRSSAQRENFTVSQTRNVKIVLLEGLLMEPFTYQNVNLAQKVLMLPTQFLVNVQNVLQVLLLSLEPPVQTNAMQINVQQDQLFHLQTLMNVRHVRLGPLKSIELLVRIVPPDLTQKKVLKNALPVQQDQ